MKTPAKQQNPPRRARLLAAALTVLLLGLLQPATAAVELPSGYYHTTVEDLTIKILGGHIKARRTWYRGRWQFNRAWNNLKIEYDALSGEISTITRNLDVYEPSGSSKELFVYDGRYTLRKLDTGFRWADRKGNWIEYDNAGHINRYGDRNNITVSFGYDSAGQRTGVFDHHGRQVLWYEYSNGRVSAVHDYTQPSPRRVEYTWVEGKLTAVKDVLGNTWRYSYSGGELTRITDPEGRPIHIAYHAESGSSTSGGTTSGGSGSSTTAAFYASDSGDSIEHARRVASVTLADGTGPRYVYDYDSTKKQFYVKTTQSSGKVTEQWYDREGYKIREDINGLTVANILHSSDRRRTVTTNELGQKTIEEYDEHRNRTKITYPDGASKSWRYDPVYSQVLQETNELGIVTQYTYDAQGNLTRMVEAVGKPAERTTTFTYDQHGQRLTQTKAGDARTATARTSYTYDAWGNLTSRTDPEGYTVRLVAHDAMGNALAMDDERGKRWRRSFDASGKLTAQINPLGQSTRYAYDRSGKLVSITDAAQNTIRYTYDASHRRVSVTDALGGEISIAYNDQGQLATVTDQTGKRLGAYSYDARGLLASTTDGAGNTVAHTYGSQGSGARWHELSAIQYPTYSETYQYDSRGRRTLARRVLSETTALETQYRYNAAGWRTALIDPKGRSTTYTHDALGRLASVADPAEGVTAYTYDDRDNLLEVHNARGIRLRRYTYDGNDRRTAEIWPDERAWRYTFDPVGNPATRIDAKGQRRVFTFDDARRLVSLQDYQTDGALARSSSFSYDQLGRLTGYDDGTTRGSYTYDPQHRLTGATVDYGAFSKSLGYSYHRNGLKASFTGADGTTTQYGYDVANRLVSIQVPGQGSLSYTAHQWFAPTRAVLPGGGGQSFAYDALMRPQRIAATDPANQPLLDYRYDYDRAGNITQKTTSQGTHHYDYDRLDRLTQADNPTLADEAYTYDPVGNRLSSLDTTEAWEYDASDQLLGHDTATFQYDANGGLIQKTVKGVTTEYRYGTDSRLRAVALPDGRQASYYYDPFGRRLWKEVDGERTYFLYAEEGLVAEFDASGQPIREYGYKPDSTWGTAPLWMKAGGETYYYLNDHLGTPQQLVTAGGRRAWGADYAAFGEAKPLTTAVDNPLRFPGQYVDQETGLHYNWHRYYDTQTGRYIASDPIGLAAGVNTYQYASSNSLTITDPTGLVDWSGTVSGGAIIAAGFFVFDLETECVNGKKGYAKVLMTGPGIGAGLLDASASQSSITLTDATSSPAPRSVFNDRSLEGGFIATAAWSMGQTASQRLGQKLGGGSGKADGVGCAAVRLGDAGGSGCGSIFGVDVSIGLFFGSSTVLEARVEDCSCTKE
ncbi:RHS repeat-associated core domain-containing protein [Alkalilimnicola sp. S0819]|uniref:RHS repeat-associated core domain-containing protein n=1 Tax=Alkalilimnicola sp. S0819 TaxID=2613922 RepID=UPI00186A0206|nr:RHS repeat-associated core domain-containing protein [Alkalilimnicola sp. S0819]